MSRCLLAVSGKMYSGKDTFAGIFLEAAGTGWRRAAFADALKAEVAALMGLSVEALEAQKSIYRPMLLEIGQKRRNIDPLYWVKRTLEQPGNLVIPDLRFANEKAALLAAGATLVRIESSLSARMTRGVVLDHPLTESALDAETDWHYQIHNDSSREAFTETCWHQSGLILERGWHAYP